MSHLANSFARGFMDPIGPGIPPVAPEGSID